MLRSPPKSDYMPSTEQSGFVPELLLNTFVQRQFSALNQCDTITVDPHKSGFCPYPAGALCYRDKNLNNFLSLSSDVVYYHGDTNLGDVGLEGSKPGAAAAGVMLANNVSRRPIFFIELPREEHRPRARAINLFSLLSDWEKGIDMTCLTIRVKLLALPTGSLGSAVLLTLLASKL